MIWSFLARTTFIKYGFENHEFKSLQVLSLNFLVFKHLVLCDILTYYVLFVVNFFFQIICLNGKTFVLLLRIKVVMGFQTKKNVINICGSANPNWKSELYFMILAGLSLT